MNIPTAILNRRAAVLRRFAIVEEKQKGMAVPEFSIAIVKVDELIDLRDWDAAYFAMGNLYERLKQADKHGTSLGKWISTTGDDLLKITQDFSSGRVIDLELYVSKKDYKVET